jgi:HAE1 family hydrophobic/amphiphilic exporter-1
VIAAIAIPVSIISTFGLMRIAGFTLNAITMLALTLAVGIVIDDAIVVLENIYRFVEEKGKTPYEAALSGTKEIGLAVLATTLSLVVVFLPVAFMGGIVGRFMNSFGLTMAFSIIVSLVVSFVLTPMLSARWLKANKNTGKNREVIFHGPIEAAPGAGLVVHHRWVIVVACFATRDPVLGGIANKTSYPTRTSRSFQ